MARSNRDSRGLTSRILTPSATRGSRIEAEIAYRGQFFHLRIRNDGNGIDRNVLEQGARHGYCNPSHPRFREVYR